MSEKFFETVKTPETHEKKPDVSLPASEDILSAREGVAWLLDCAADNACKHQIQERRIAKESLEAVLAHLPQPDITLEQALEKKLVTEDEIIHLQNSLSSVMNNPDYRRIILYLPFQFLMDPQNISHAQLKASSEQFKQTYIHAWKSLLTTHDVRANFVDGDVLEVEKRQHDLPRVVKAAHLIPFLIQNEYLNFEEVLTIYNQTEDPVLRHSIADTLPVLVDMHLIDTGDLDWIVYRDTYVQQKIKSIQAPRPIETQHAAPLPQLTSTDLAQQLATTVAQIDSEVIPGTTPKRASWLRQEKKRVLVDTTSNDLQKYLAHHQLDTSLLTTLAEHTTVMQHVLIEALRKATEERAHTQPNTARAFYATYEQPVLHLWKQCAPDTKDVLQKMFFRLQSLNVITEDQLNQLGLKRPALAGPFSKNLENMRQEIADTNHIALEMANSPELAPYVFPVILLFGSKLKGYGSSTADTDWALFVKPDIAKNQADTLHQKLHNFFSHYPHINASEIIQFWLEKKDQQLTIRDNINGAYVGKKWWTHVLFGAVWEGDPRSINEIKRHLLPSYFNNQQPHIHDREARGLYLEELERDTLQYRLMHKGYAKFFPEYGGLTTPHADHVDGHSIFWDSGYRQLATQLFINRVFLPKKTTS
jgi:hypothetical protein